MNLGSISTQLEKKTLAEYSLLILSFVSLVIRALHVSFTKLISTQHPTPAPFQKHVWVSSLYISDLS